MTVTRHARELARRRADRRIAAQKDEYRRKIRRIQQAFEPPLTNAELSVGLDLDDADAATAGTVGRFVSESPKLAKARPDTATRALIDALLEGDLLLAVADGVPGARRQVVVGDARDFRRLGSVYELVNLAGGPVPERPSRSADWNDGERWNLFGETNVADQPVTRSGGVVVPRRICGRDVHPVGFGAMRLSTTNVDNPETVLDAYLDAALGSAPHALIDTADVYGQGEDDVGQNAPGHNEGLIRRVLDRRGDGERVLVATKAGMRRPGGGWTPDGRPEHLRRAVESSLARLGGDELHLVQLHVVDPKVPLEESVGELARLRDEGKVRHVGLCNVGVADLEAAREIVEVASVQVAASVFERKIFAPGELAERCHELGIPVVAHSPLGGHRRKTKAGDDATVRRVAEARGSEPWQVALAWLLRMGPQVIPIPGTTSAERARLNVGAAEIGLDAEEIESLGGKASHRRRIWSVASPPERAVLILGPPAAGKTSRVDAYVERGYRRLNRDREGGKLAKLERIMQRELDDGRRAFVLDNTYPTRASRKGVIELAREHGLEVVALHLDVPLGEALYNACLRMLERHGRILGPEEIKALGRQDPNMLPPTAIYNYFSRHEEPTEAEGFDRVERIAFERRKARDQSHKALLLDVDGTLRKTKSGAPFPHGPDDVEILPNRREVLDHYAEEDWLLFGVSNQSAVGKGQVTKEQVEAAFDRTRELLGRDLEILYCSHQATSAGVWRRKPMPGMAVELIERHRLDRDRCVVVGDLESDREFAELAGMEFQWASELFGE